MARTINILPENLANKIAAGEVVQRPASAVKELMENSIDAGAKAITVIIKEVGKKLIHILDDGSGMSADDAAVAFERHATSKIATYEDLENIRTLGFRGEALASIAAVSHVELRTRQAASDVGTKVRIEGGIVLDISEDAPAPGTSIIVKNLFYNTPARRNFLKSNNTEFKHIFDVVQRVAISHPELAIKFVSDDEMILDLHAGDHEERLQEIFGEKFAQGLISFADENEYANVNGFLCKPDFARKTRTEQFLFMNNRYIVNRSINHAVFQAYEHLLEKGSFPLFILFLKIDPTRVDVNVHPSKMEVKFDDDSSIYRFVMSGVRKALSAHDLVPVAGMREENSQGQDFAMRFKTGTDSTPHRVASWEQLLRPIGATDEITQTLPSSDHQESLDFNDTTLKKVDQSFAAQSEPAHQITPTEQRRAALWQIHNKYIFVPIENGVMIVDQHAAHERVLYERAVIRFDQVNTKSQQLLFPHTIELTAGDAALVHQLSPLLESLGFSLKMFGKTTVIVEGVPIDVKPGKEGTILQDVLDLFKEDEQKLKLEPREQLAKSYSCKAAVKAGDPLNDSEMRSLLDQLFATQIPYSCPHGRPVIVKLSLSELDRRFGRTS